MSDDRPEPWASLAERADARVNRWLQSTQGALSASASTNDLLSGAREQTAGVNFARDLLELLGGTEDAFISALGLRRLSQQIPDGLDRKDRLALRLGGIAAIGMPWAVVPLARRWLRGRIAHLVCVSTLPSEAEKPAEFAPLQEALSNLTNRGTPAQVSLTGDAVVGPRSAQRERARLRGLLRLDDVQHLLVDPHRFVSGTSWELDDLTEQLTREFTDLADEARGHGVTVSLDVTHYEHARAVMDAARTAVEDPALFDVSFGVTAAAEIPETTELLNSLLVQLALRAREGGAPVEVRVTTRSTLPREAVRSIQTGLAVPVLETRAERDAAALRLVKLLAGAAGVRPVLVSDSPYLVAAALELCADAETPLVVETRSGVNSDLDRALLEAEQQVRTLLPVVPQTEFGAMVEQLVLLTAEAAQNNSALSRQAMLNPENLSSETLRQQELALLDEVSEFAVAPAPASRRVQDRAREWDPSERDSALFYRSPEDPATHDTGGLTAAVLGLTKNDDTGEIEVTPAPAPVVIPPVSGSGFANEPVTDATRRENREWFATQLEAAAALRDEIETHERMLAEADPEEQEAAVREAAERARAAGSAWSQEQHALHGRVLRRIAYSTVAARDRLTQGFAAAHGEPAQVLDAHVNLVVDAARYTAGLAEELTQVRGATFVPDELTVVVAGDITVSAQALEVTVASLAAGSAVLMIGSPRIEPLMRVIREEWTEAGLPEGALEFVGARDVHETAETLVSSVEVDRAIVIAARDTARTLLEARPELRVESHSGGVGTLLITPAAELERAIADAVESAFTGSDRALRGAQALLLLGSVARSGAVREQLADAVRGIAAGDTVTHRAAVGDVRDDSAGHDTAGHDIADDNTADDGTATDDLAPDTDGADIDSADIDSADADMAIDTRGAFTRELAVDLADYEAAQRSLADQPRTTNDPLAIQVAPLTAPPTEAQMRALTELAEGEEWLVQPRQLDTAGVVWSPGVKLGVKPHASFWADAAGVPVLGVVHVHSIHEAIAVHRTIGSGAIAGIHSWDPNEVIPWLDRVEAAALTVNRPTTGAKIERHPSGSWGEGGMGATPLAGGPHELVTHGSWRVRPGTQSSTLHLRGLDEDAQLLIELAQHSLGYEEFDRVRRAALADMLSWRTQLGVVRDHVGLGVERNLLRYWPVRVHVRAAEDASIDELLRVLIAGLLVQAPIEVSTGIGLPEPLHEALTARGIRLTIERDDDWYERLGVHGPTVDGVRADRLRLISGDRERVAEIMGGSEHTALWSEPVTMAGPVELLSMLREQSISMRADRYGMHALSARMEKWLRDLGR